MTEKYADASLSRISVAYKISKPGQEKGNGIEVISACVLFSTHRAIRQVYTQIPHLI